MRVVIVASMVLGLTGSALAQSGSSPPGPPPSSPRPAQPPSVTTPPAVPGEQRATVTGRRQPPAGANAPAQAPSKGAAKNPVDDEYADCMRLWEPATHMTKPEWSRTCRRVQSRLNQVQIK